MRRVAETARHNRGALNPPLVSILYPLLYCLNCLDIVPQYLGTLIDKPRHLRYLFYVMTDVTSKRRDTRQRWLLRSDVFVVHDNHLNTAVWTSQLNQLSQFSSFIITITFWQR